MIFFEALVFRCDLRRNTLSQGLNSNGKLKYAHRVRVSRLVLLKKYKV